MLELRWRATSREEGRPGWVAGGCPGRSPAGTLSQGFPLPVVQPALRPALRRRLSQAKNSHPQPPSHRQLCAGAQRGQRAARRAQRLRLVGQHQGGQGGEAGRVRRQLSLQQRQLLPGAGPGAACAVGEERGGRCDKSRTSSGYAPRSFPLLCARANRPSPIGSHEHGRPPPQGTRPACVRSAPASHTRVVAAALVLPPPGRHPPALLPDSQSRTKARARVRSMWRRKRWPRPRFCGGQEQRSAMH